MILVSKKYMWPVLVLILGVLGSVSLYQYEYGMETSRIQSEFDIRSEGHRGGMVESLQDLHSQTVILSDLSLHDANESFNDINQDGETYVSWLKDSLKNSGIIHDLIWVDALQHDSSPTQRVWMQDGKVQSLLAYSMASKHEGFETYHADSGAYWMIQAIPSLYQQDIQGVWLIAWDIGAVMENGLKYQPISGIDIQCWIVRGSQKKQVYKHLSRTRTSGVKTQTGDFIFEDMAEVNGQHWLFTYASAPAFMQAHPRDDAIRFLFVGLLMTLLLAWLSLLLYKRGRIVKEKVKQKTRELKTSQNRLTLLVNSIAEGLYEADLNGCCTFINQRALQLFGYQDKADVLGKDVHEVFHHSYADGSNMLHRDCKIMRLLEAVEAVEAVEANDECFWRVDGTSFPVSYRATPVLNQSREVVGAVVTFLDISEQIKAHEEAEAMRLQVEHTQRLESLGVLAGGIAHDFNNLLSVIMGNVGIARMHVCDICNIERPLDRVEKASQRAADLCKQMLAYAGEGRFVVQPLNLSEVLQDIGQLMDVSMNKKVRLHYQLADPIFLVAADKSQLQQIAMNLLTNANEAMDESLGGDVFVETGVKTLTQGDIQHAYGEWQVVNEGDFVYLEVKDYGCGMSKETQSKVFDPFFSTKFTGRGLGMSAILGIVRGHHGFLTLKSALQQGTTITIYFPALITLSSGVLQHDEVRPEATGTLEKIAATYSMGLSERRGEALILVVDDENALREMTGLMLQDDGYDVLYAGDGEEALAIYAEESDVIDLVVLDMTMPRMNGETCLEKLREIRDDVRVLLVSGYHETEFQHLGDFLGKPFSVGALKQKISKLLQS